MVGEVNCGANVVCLRVLCRYGLEKLVFYMGFRFYSIGFCAKSSFLYGLLHAWISGAFFT